MSKDDDQQLHEICDRFDAEWASDRAPEIADFLPDGADKSKPSRKTVLIELVIIDLERRWLASTMEAATLPPDAAQFPAKPTLEDYVGRYPELGPIDSLPIELIGWEYRIRQQWGDRPDRDEYLRRFPAQAKEMQSALDKIDKEVSIDATVASSPPDATTSQEDVTLPSETSRTIAIRVRAIASATSASTSCWTRLPAAEWASSSKPGRSS